MFFYLTSSLLCFIIAICDYNLKVYKTMSGNYSCGIYDCGICAVYAQNKSLSIKRKSISVFVFLFNWVFLPILCNFLSYCFTKVDSNRFASAQTVNHHVGQFFPYMFYLGRII